MTGKHTRSGLRSTFTNRELRRGKINFPHSSVGVFMQVTLAIVYMYLILISYTWMGIMGSVMMSGFFLVALFLPVVHRLVVDNRIKPKSTDSEIAPEIRTGLEQEG